MSGRRVRGSRTPIASQRTTWHVWTAVETRQTPLLRKSERAALLHSQHRVQQQSDVLKVHNGRTLEQWCRFSDLPLLPL